jgi:hypothetical protein
MARATSSLPVPVSPSSSTALSTGATIAIASATSPKAALFPISGPAMRFSSSTPQKWFIARATCSRPRSSITVPVRTSERSDGRSRAPTLAELYRSFETPTFRGLSNPELEEERLRGGDVGVDLRRGRVAAQLNGFYNRLENFVGSAEVGFIDGKFTVMATNVAEIRSRGVESMIAFRAWEHVTIDANYMFTDSEVVEGALTGNEVEGAPENVAALGATYSRARTTVTLKGR